MVNGAIREGRDRVRPSHERGVGRDAAWPFIRRQPSREPKASVTVRRPRRGVCFGCLPTREPREILTWNATWFHKMERHAVAGEEVPCQSTVPTR